MVCQNLPAKTIRLISSLRGKTTKKILFICLGNICRSPAAEGLMREVVKAEGDSGRWIIDSAGIGGWHVGDLPDHRMRIHARRRGLDLTHHCRKVTQSDFFDFDIIIGMDSSNLSDLRRLAPNLETENKIVAMADFLTCLSHFDHIPDPYYDGAQGFETVLDLLTEATQNLYDTLTRHHA